MSPVPAPEPIMVLDEGTSLSFSFEDLLRYSGPGSPAGVAVAYQAMRCAFPILDLVGPLERRVVAISTAFRGPGARDGFELVTRSLTEGRYQIDLSLERPDRGPTLEAFVFELRYRERAVTLMVRDGVIGDEFIALARQDDRSAMDEARFAELKCRHADELLAASPTDIFETATGYPARKYRKGADGR